MIGKIFEIPAIRIFFNFPALDFIGLQDKRAGISKKNSVILCPIFIRVVGNNSLSFRK